MDKITMNTPRLNQSKISLIHESFHIRYSTFCNFSCHTIVRIIEQKAVSSKDVISKAFFTA